jgi:murein DD-endopeptidase MepM/ murein hydrolase activator NlpD
MSFLRSTETLKTAASLLGVAAVSAMPALAAGGERPEHDPAARAAKEQREAWQEARRRREDGPFVPVVGKPDYGTAENAFGAARSGHMHAGHDLFARPGTPLVAVSDSVVAEVGSDGGQGNYVYLYDRKRESTFVYMHMLAPAEVRTGDRVAAGERVGAVGCTGSCWGDHLHFEVRKGRGIADRPVDPLPMLRQWEPLDRPRH